MEGCSLRPEVHSVDASLHSILSAWGFLPCPLLVLFRYLPYSFLLVLLLMPYGYKRLPSLGALFFFFFKFHCPGLSLTPLQQIHHSDMAVIYIWFWETLALHLGEVRGAQLG